jgi:membrane-associated protein
MTPADLFNVQDLVGGAGVWGLAIVCAIVFAETGLLIGFFLPGDTLLFFTGLLAYTGAIPVPIAIVVIAVAASAFLGDQLGFVIGRRAGPAVFERRDSGFFSRANVGRTQSFFDRFGGWAVTIARFIAVVRTFAPVAAGVGRMKYSHFVGFNALGAVIWSALLVLVGYALGSIPEVAAVVEQYLEWVLIGLVVITVGSAIVTYLRQRSRARSERQAPEGDPGMPPHSAPLE